MFDKIPILPTAILALILPVKLASQATRILIPWILAGLCVLACVHFFISGISATEVIETHFTSELDELPPTRLFIILTFSLLFLCIAGFFVAVAWHRHILRPDSVGESLPTHLFLVFCYAFFGFVILIPGSIAAALAGFGSFFVVGAASTNISQIHGHLVSLITYAIFVAITARLGIILPAIALNEKRVWFSDAWSLTKGNGVRLTIITILIFIPLTVINTTAQWIIAESSTLSMLFHSVLFVVQMYYLLVTITLLSLSFGFFVEDKAIELHDWHAWTGH